MARDPSTRDLSDKHADYIEAMFEARTMRGSGNQSNRPTDNRMDGNLPYAFAFEGKSTRQASLSIKITDWHKLLDQSHALRPALAYRFYRNDNLLVPDLDLVAVRADDFAEILAVANGAE